MGLVLYIHPTPKTSGYQQFRSQWQCSTRFGSSILAAFPLPCRIDTPTPYLVLDVVMLFPRNKGRWWRHHTPPSTFTCVSFTLPFDAGSQSLLPLLSQTWAPPGGFRRNSMVDLQSWVPQSSTHTAISRISTGCWWLSELAKSLMD